MRRAPFVLLALLALGPSGSAWAEERPKLAAKLAACETGASPAERFAVFTGSMPALRGTRRMAMRFELQERGSDESGPQAVAAPRLGRWNRSKAGVAGFVYTKRVTNLTPGRWYRAIVRFRWHNARGRLQRAAKRVTPFCHQPDQRPNLKFESLRSPRSGSYLVTIVNTGMTAAPESTVTVEPHPQRTFIDRVPPLAPGERTSVVVDGDPCERGSVVVVQLDAFRVVDESREHDNRVESDCPPADRVG